MPKVSHTPPDLTRLPSHSSSPKAATAARWALSFDQMLLPRPTNTTQSSAVPTIEAHNALEQLSTAATQITNNVPTVQTIDQTISTVSDQFLAQQLRVQREIQEQVKSTNACFAALAEQMQQLITTIAAAATACNPPTPRPPPVTSWFHGTETCDIYIPNETLRETELAQVFSQPPVHVKPKAPSTDTLYNNKFSCTARGEDEASRAAPQRHLQPTASPFGFSDYPPNDYYDYPQPG
uniref:Uncharacterized protein n=1 Tax=Romanomermis culicivorax TaxID=13658 RepID=A0A915K7U5_ROMCU